MGLGGSELGYHMYDESVEHLTDQLGGALDEDLLGPPVVFCHVVQKPLKTYTVCEYTQCVNIHGVKTYTMS